MYHTQVVLSWSKSWVWQEPLAVLGMWYEVKNIPKCISKHTTASCSRKCSKLGTMCILFLWPELLHEIKTWSWYICTFHKLNSAVTIMPRDMAPSLLHTYWHSHLFCLTHAILMSNYLWLQSSTVAIKGKPDREIIFMNIPENGVCNISITTTPFVIWMLSNVSLRGIEWPRIPNFLTKCVINTVWAIFINYNSFNARHGLHIRCKEWSVRLCSMTWNCCAYDRISLVLLLDWNHFVD